MRPQEGCGQLRERQRRNARLMRRVARLREKVLAVDPNFDRHDLDLILWNLCRPRKERQRFLLSDFMPRGRQT